MSKKFDALCDAHAEVIAETYPDRHVNFGWVQDPKSITSKVYGTPFRAVSSWYDKQGNIVHEINDEDGQTVRA